MKYDYSFKKSLAKAVMFVLQALATIVIVTGFSEISLWSLAEQYIKPLVGTLSIGATIALATNFVKYNWLS